MQRKKWSPRLVLIFFTAVKILIKAAAIFEVFSELLLNVPSKRVGCSYCQTCWSANEIDFG